MISRIDPNVLRAAPLAVPLIAISVYFTVRKTVDVFRQITGYFLRTSVFMFGVYNEGPLKRLILEGFKKNPCKLDVNERSPFDLKRLNAGIKLLKELGGKDLDLTTPHCTITGMTFTHKDALKKISENGAVFERIKAKKVQSGQRIVYEKVADDVQDAECVYLKVIRAKDSSGQAFLKEMNDGFKWHTVEGLGQVFLKKDETEEKILVVAHSDQEFPIISDERRPVEIRCHSPTSSAYMEKFRVIRLLLDIESDVVIWDYPGTFKSKGFAYETTYNYAIEKLYLEIKNRGYSAPRIIVSGFCLGGAVAGFLKMKYHNEGVHYMGVNTFDSLTNLFKHQGGFLGRLARFAMPCLRDPKINIYQDGFDTVKKFELLNNNKNSFAFFIHTSTDKTIAPDSQTKLAAAADKSCKVFIEMFKPNKPGDGHGENPEFHPPIWAKIREVFSKCIQDAIPA